MKHLFNNLSEEEKKTILEMHGSKNEIISEQSTQPGRLTGVGQDVTAGVKGGQGRRAGRQEARQLTKDHSKITEILKKITSWSTWMTKQINTIKPALEALKAEAASVSSAHSYKKSIESTIVNYQKTLDSLIALNNAITENGGSSTRLPQLTFGKEASSAESSAVASTSNPQSGEQVVK
jgi:hypothetical protein